MAETETRWETCKPVRRLVDVWVRIDPPSSVGWLSRGRSMERYAAELEAWVKEFHDFLRDHRHQDPTPCSLERTYEDQCSVCGAKWEEDEGACASCGREADRG